MKKWVLTLLVILNGLFGVFATETNRPAEWAAPIALEGVPNLYKVSDKLYRSAQPTAIGMQNLEKMGIKTVINLRSFHSDQNELKGTGLTGEHLFVKAWHPEREEALRFLQIVTDPARTPALVHCQHGADRTGTFCAVYRIAIQNWTKDNAIKEMTDGGFGFHEVWNNLPEWIEKLDVGPLRQK